MNIALAILSVLIVAGSIWVTTKYEPQIEEAKSFALILLLVAGCAVALCLMVLLVYLGLTCTLSECPSWAQR